MQRTLQKVRGWLRSFRGFAEDVTDQARCPMVYVRDGLHVKACLGDLVEDMRQTKAVDAMSQAERRGQKL